MIRLARKGQRALTASLLMLRDEFSAFDEQLGEFVVSLKTHLDPDVSHVGSYADLQALLQQLEATLARPVNRKPFAAYDRVRVTLRRLLDAIERDIWDPLAQVGVLG